MYILFTKQNVDNIFLKKSVPEGTQIVEAYMVKISIKYQL